jgi:hypothetical protein
MQALKIIGEIDEQRRLIAAVPDSIAPGKVSLLVLGPADEDETGDAWMAGIAHEWQDELSDPREDIYTLNDGKPVDASR